MKLLEMETLKITLLVLIFSAYFNERIEGKLKQLNVVFRHGDRAPDNNGLESYPNNPYAHKKFLPIGEGGLTNTGKRREFKLGRFLRREYGNFLGPEYLRDEVYARSTYFDRTKMSLQLVLAGLYAPDNTQRWNDYLDWQPIPTNFLADLDDVLMTAYECPRYLKAREEATAQPELIEKTEKFRSFMNYLTMKTGKNITQPIDMTYLYHGLKATESMGLELPDWTHGIFPHGRLHDGIDLEYEVASYTDDMKRLNGGMLLRKITDDMSAACKGETRPKISLYSGHEFNIATVLQSLNVYNPHVPRYSSAVIFELHEDQYDCKVKVMYYKGIADEGEPTAEELQVPGCDTGYFGEFMRVLGNHIATDDDILSCDKRSLREDLERGAFDIPDAITKPLLDAIYDEDKMYGVLR